MIKADKQKRRFPFALKNNYLYPNIVTLLGLMSGVFAILLSIRDDNIFVSAMLLVLAVIFDLLDGKVARLLNATSEFGVQLDSLCDSISFGVAPAIVVYMWLDKPFGRLGILITFLYIACGVLRLARFNVLAGKVSSDYFTGLPIPAAAGFIASTILIVETHGMGIDKGMLSIAVITLVFALSLLMVSPIPFYSFKNVPFFRKHPYNTLVIFVFILITVIMFYEVALFIVGVLYLSIGLLVGLRRLSKIEQPLAKETTGEGIEQDNQ